MSLEEARRKLPIVDQLPAHDSRRARPRAPGQAPEPRYAILEITLACDLACTTCGSRAGTARPAELSLADFLTIIDELAELGTGEIILIGGEAYLRNDFLQMIRRIRERGLRCAVVTGGYNLSAERCAAMAEAGVVEVSVSIDGLRAQHDELRGVRGSWDRCFQAFAHLRAAGISYTCNTQINRVTQPVLGELLERLAAERIRAWQIQITSPFGRAADAPEILLQPYDYPELFETLGALALRCHELGIQVHAGNNLGYFGPHEAKLRRARRGAHYTGCDAGVSAIGIESDGTIKACPSLGGATNDAGNWRDFAGRGGLRAIWSEGRGMNYVRTRGPEVLWGFCAECYYAEVCMGGCTATAEPLIGRPGNNPFCHHRAMVMRQRGLRERIELVRRAPGVPFDHGLFRIVREHLDPELREREGPVQVDEPRTDRLVDPSGAGRPLTAEELAAPWR